MGFHSCNRPLGHPRCCLLLRGRNDKCTAEEGGQAGPDGRTEGPARRSTTSTLEESLKMASSLVLLRFLYFSPSNVLTEDQCPPGAGKGGRSSKRLSLRRGGGANSAGSCLPFLPQQTTTRKSLEGRDGAGSLQYSQRNGNGDGKKDPWVL